MTDGDEDEQLRTVALQNAQSILLARRRAEDALRKQSEVLRVTLSSIGDAVISTDTQANVVFMNSVAEALTGWPQAEAVGRPLSEVFHIVNEHTRQPVENPALRALREGVIVALANHTVLIARDGTECPIDDSAAPIRDADGEVAGAVLVFRDIAAKRRAENELRTSEEFSRTVLESSPDCVKVLDADGHLLTMNKNGLCVMEIDNFSVFSGQPWVTLWPEEGRGHVAAAVASAQEGRTSRFQAFAPTAKNTPKWWDVIVSPVRDGDGRVLRIVSVSRDVTEQREIADSLRKLAADLSEADRRKNEFLAILAHELRSPLAPLRNAAKIARLAGAENAPVQAATAIMERQIGQLVRLVDDLLDVTRISQGKIELRNERVGVASVVRQAVEAVRPVVDRMGHQLSVTLPSEPIYVNGDSVRLTQILGNLLNNACKFTERGGRIWLTVEGEGECVALRVRDSGIGIAIEQRHRVFDMFAQVDTSLERTQGGLGIGLMLVRELVQMHGGSVDVHSAGIGQGSEFVVRLPRLARMPSPVPEHVVSEPPLITGRRILVVDDNRDSAESLATLLELSGNVTRTAHDGREAVEAAASFKPEAVLLDIGLPKMNGYEAAREIRQQPWGKAMVLIALTGWGQDEDRQKSKDAGFDCHLVKPVDLTALTNLLAAVPSERPHVEQAAPVSPSE